MWPAIGKGVGETWGGGGANNVISPGPEREEETF